MENKTDAENGFFQQVYAIVVQIPAGQTLSYGEIARMLEAYPHCRLHVDATQAVGKIPISFQYADTMSLAAHKFYGLNGVGLLLRREDVGMEPLIHGGVTPVERVGGSCWVIRGVTTRTKTGQASDQTWRDLTTILVVDDVIPGVREALRARFPRAKNTAQTRGAVQSLVVEVLERKLAAEVITGYDAVEVTALADEPGICLVTFGFTVTHGMDQIWLSAEVTV